MASSTKAIAIQYTAEEIATSIQSVETIANRCWRKKIISNEVYKEVLRPHPLADTANKALLLVNAVEASIREEEAHFGEFLEILGNELEPQVAKELISRIGYHLEETRERTNLDQCTKDTQDELDHGQKEAVTETTDTPFVQVSKDSNLSADKSDSTSNASSILRNRKQGTHTCTALHGSNHSYHNETLCKHTGTHNVSESAKVEPVQATNEMPHTSGLHTNNFLQSNDVEPLQATDETTLEQRQETLRRLQKEKFAEYDKLQAEANNQMLLDENKSLKRQLEQQSIDHSHICDKKKKLEKELSDKCLKVDQLLVERSQRIASHRHNLDQLRNQVAENEKERNELEARCKDLEQRIKDITETYDSKISQYQCEIQVLQEELDSMKSIVDDQSSMISEQQQEIRRLSSGVITLQDKFEKKCMDFDDYRRVTEFKSDTRAFLVFLVVFVIIIEVILKVVFFIGLFNSLY